jgi:Icc-related predicted phosphoesterase
VTRCLFASDLHGDPGRYAALFDAIRHERPDAVFLGGDLLPGGLGAAVGALPDDFVREALAPGIAAARRAAGSATRVFLILGNDDGRCEEEAVLEAERAGVWEYAHGRALRLGTWTVYGYACVPPTPFLLKDWERYDVSRHVDPDCVSPEEGWRTVPASEDETRWSTIQSDLERLAGDADQERAVWLFHSPPYRCRLDRADLAGRVVDHVPLDPHVGSIAIRRFLEARQPWLSLHGHVHESARLTGDWRDRIGRTPCLSAAHDGPELALVRFALDEPGAAERALIPSPGLPGPADAPRP